MFVKSLLLSLAICFLDEVECRTQTGKPLPPSNLTLRWQSDFEPQLWWRHEQLPPNCTYKVFRWTTEQNSELERICQTPPSVDNLAMEGGSLFFSVQTSCHHGDSKTIFLNVTYPELVSNVQCSITSSTLTRCSWVSLGSPPDLAFYYLLVNEVDDVPSGVVSLSECPRYIITEGVRTGCHLQSKTDESIHILFNATLEEGLVRNTFKKKPVQVTPPPLKWNVSEVAGKFNLSWDPPDVLGLAQWTFIINYTECGKEKIQMVEGETWKLMSRVSHCQYRMTLKARSDRGDSEWSEVKYFDKEPNASLYAAIIIPLLCASLVTLTCVCCRRNQERIFNKVPEPRDLLSDIRNNTKSERIFNLYFPEKEEQLCQISVVKDQQQHPHTTHSRLIN